jgi:hypothetical protein
MRRIHSGLEHPVTGNLFPKRVLPMLFACLLYGGCLSQQSAPSIEFTTIPLAGEGGTRRLDPIEGRVNGARPGQFIVLYARSGAWYIQPYADQPFTTIQTDSTWRSTTHLGTEYAALLGGPEFVPPAVTDVLPNQGGAVFAMATTEGTPPLIWQRRWFRLAAGLALLFALL